MICRAPKFCSHRKPEKEILTIRIKELKLKSGMAANVGYCDQHFHDVSGLFPNSLKCKEISC